MVHSDTLEELIKSLIFARDKAEHAYSSVIVLTRNERKLVRKQIDSCLQSLHFLSEQLDHADYGEMTSRKRTSPSV